MTTLELLKSEITTLRQRITELETELARYTQPSTRPANAPNAAPATITFSRTAAHDTTCDRVAPVDGVGLAEPISAPQALYRRISFEHLVAEISTRFVNLPAEQADHALTDVLQRLSEFIGADHGALFQISLSGDQVVTTASWAANGLTLDQAAIQAAELAALPGLVQMHGNNAVLHIPNVNWMGDGLAHHELHNQGIRSFTAVPLVAQNTLRGLITFCTLRPNAPAEIALSEDDLASLKLVGEIIVNAFDRWQTEVKIRQMNRTLEQRVAQRTADVSDLYNNAPCGYHSLDTTGRYVFVNDTELAWLNYTREEVIGRPFRDFLTPESAAAFERIFPDFLQAGQPMDFEYEMRRRDGQVLPILLKSLVVYDESGVSMTRTTIFDMTERKRLDRIMREGQERLNFLVANTPAVIFTAEARRHFRVTYASESVQKLLGYAPAEIVADAAFWRDHLHPDDHAELARLIVALAHDRETTAVYRMRHRDGNYRWLSNGLRVIADLGGNASEVIGYAIDITDQVLTEQALRRSETRLNFLLSETPAMIFTFEGPSRQLDQFRISYCSQSILKLLGYEPAELMQDPLFIATRTHADDLAQFAQFIPTLQEKGELVVKVRFRHADGRYRWLSCGLRLVSVPISASFEVVGYAVDITEQQETELALQRSQASLQDFLDTANDLIQSVDLDGRLTYVNHAWCETLGYSAAEAQQMNLFDLLGEKCQSRYRQQIAALLSTRQPQQLELMLNTRLGQRVYVEGSVSMHDRGDGGLIANGILRDITQRRLAQEALRISEARWRSVVEHAPATISVIDRNGIVLSINRSPHHEPKLPVDNLVGQPLLDHLGAEDAARIWRQIDAVFENNQPSEIALTLPLINGEIRHMKGFVGPIQNDEPRRSAVFIMLDITDLKRTEAELQRQRDLARQAMDSLQEANVALERAARMKDEFLATMSHELRTPLTAILGLSEGLLERLLGPLTQKQQEALTTIDSSGKHLLNLINDILDLSKIEAGVIDMAFTSVSVNTICHSSLLFIKEIASKKRIKTFLMADSAVEWIQADERRLKQMLVNLLSNAVKFTPEGGKVGLEVVGDLERGQASFIVWDTGIGIAQMDIERIFRPFIQLDSALSRQYTGTGLGLSLVARMAQLHGGSISVESQLGMGSRFTLTLPWLNEDRRFLAEAALEPSMPGLLHANPASDVLATAKRAPLILLVEDNEANIQTVKSYLEAKNYDVLVARNGAEGLTLAKEHRPALILMDVQMPIMDGIEATRRLHQDPDTALATTPIIALTALAMPGDRDRLMSAGVDFYLSKPVNLKHLVKLIEQMLGV